MKASDLIVGRTYFRLTFADRDLTMPGVEPLVFLGEVMDDGGTRGFAFQDTASFVQHGSGLEGEEQHDEIVIYFLPESEIGALYDIGELTTEIAEAAQRAVSSNYPMLTPGTHGREVMPDRTQDPFNLDRFVKAQSQNYEEALAELRAGRKRTHWSWYVLPQIHGLGSSEMSLRYAISGAAEAKAYLDHRVLGARLLECVAAINAHRGLSAADILGATDAQKLHSCATLFAAVSADGSPFHAALARYFAGDRDRNTVAILSSQSTSGPGSL